MCQKRQHRCAVALHLREQALMEWTRAETFEEVRSAWSRLGGRIVLHRYGSAHFALLGRIRHGDVEARQMLAARMQRRRKVA